MPTSSVVLTQRSRVWILFVCLTAARWLIWDVSGRVARDVLNRGYGMSL